MSICARACRVDARVPRGVQNKDARSSAPALFRVPADEVARAVNAADDAMFAPRRAMFLRLPRCFISDADDDAAKMLLRVR